MSLNRGPVPVKLYKKETAEKIQLGPMTCYIFEDGGNCDNRVSSIVLEIPAGKSGPPMHWHRFHDELFLVTKGKQSKYMCFGLVLTGAPNQGT
jgi:hypothetical protein